MEAVIIILLIILIGFSFAIWQEGHAKNQPADNGLQNTQLQEKVDSLQKTMDESLVRIMFLEDKAKAAFDKKEQNEIAHG